MRRSIILEIFMIATIVTIVNATFAETLKSLPEPTGPYQIGISKYDLSDKYRKEINYPNGRLIPVQIYFPMEKEKQLVHSKIFEERAPEQCKSLDVRVYGQKEDLSSLISGKHPVIFLFHGNTVAMTDYASIAEDLASNGYIVVTIQHQLNTDPEEPGFWNERSISKFGNVIDNMLCVFEWLKDNQEHLFDNKINLNRIGFIGHSMGGYSLLLSANRSSKKKKFNTLLPYNNPDDVKEAIIFLDIGAFPYHNQYPTLLLLSEDRKNYLEKTGAYDEMIKIGHTVLYYRGAKHISFMDHGYVDPVNPFDQNEHYFNGTLEERKAFFDHFRKDIREFLKEYGITE